MNKTFVCYQKTSLPRSPCRASDQNASQKEINLPAASLEQSTTTRKHQANRLLTKTNLSGSAQNSPGHQRSPGAALSSQTPQKPFQLKEKMLKRMVLLMMLYFSFSCFMPHTEGMFAGSHFCSFNGSTRYFFCNKVHEIPRYIPKNTTFV